METRVIDETLGADGKVARLVERREVRHETSLVTPEGPQLNREAASLSRYFIVSAGHEITLPFLEAKDDYRPAFWATSRGLWLAQVVPPSEDVQLVLFDSSGNLLDRCLVHLPFGRANGESVRFDKEAEEIVYLQKTKSLRFRIREQKIVLVESE
ncbi:MAG: hypothetical protein RL091_1309 [Verrucomicrobiota bacterium]|jgi:hypothetical protein